jgi:hypothetical protein
VVALVSTYTGLAFPKRRPGRRERPHLPGHGVLAFAQPCELDRVAVAQIAGEEHRHVGFAAQAVAQVDDQRVGGREQAHRGGDDLPAQDGREQDRLQVEIADVAGQALRAGNAAAGLVGPPGIGGVFLGVVAGRAQRDGFVVVLQPQVLVAVDRLQVGGDRCGQRRWVGGVASADQPGGQHSRHTVTAMSGKM